MLKVVRQTAWRRAWRTAALASALVATLAFALEPAAGSVEAASGTPQLRRIVINGIGELAKMLREIDAQRANLPDSETDVYALIVAYWGPLALKNDVVPAMKRAGGHAGLRIAATRFFSQTACWGLHSASMIKEASDGDRRGAEREENRARRCLSRARVAQVEVARLLRATA